MPTTPRKAPERTFRVTRTETIEYVADFTESELVGYGFERELLDAEAVVHLNDELTSGYGDDFRDNLTEALERFGDVQGSTFSACEVR